jgi:hypothetical protein
LSARLSPYTRSSGRNRVTPGPTSSTTPAMSDPGSDVPVAQPADPGVRRRSAQAPGHAIGRRRVRALHEHVVGMPGKLTPPQARRVTLSRASGSARALASRRIVLRPRSPRR